MKRLTSRHNPLIAHLRKLGTDKSYRQEHGEYLCDGEKLLREAIAWGADITAILWKSEPEALPDCVEQYLADWELMNYVSPLKTAAQVLFSVRMKQWDKAEAPGRTLVLESIQDPGNLGTILRTANALGIDTVILTGDCADAYNPKTIRAGMGAIFRQRWIPLERENLKAYLAAHGIRLCGAALSEESADIRQIDLRRTAVAIGSEGQGLSETVLSACDEALIIPMRPQCESLNAAVAAAIVMWELAKQDQERGQSYV